MKTNRIVQLAGLMLSLFVTNVTFAHEAHNKGELLPVTEKEAAWAATAKAEYPTKDCVVSDEKLEDGSMGPVQDMIYRVKGQPDRLVRFCCKHCVDDFKEDPAKYLKILDEAKAKAKK